MGADQNIDWRSSAASALEWWHDAGVDILVDDAPRDWFAAPEPIFVPAAAPSIVPGGALAASSAMPDTLPEFLAWRAGAAVPEADWSGASLIASGPADATVMVLVDHPERADGESGDGIGGLLGGPAGRLFDRMLAAIGLARAEIHLAAVCTKRPTAGRIQREVEDRLGEIARHHVALVAPERLLLLGNAASRAILTTEMSGARGHLHPFNHKTGQTGVVASFHPRFLIEKPAAKAEAWKDLRMLMGDLMSESGAA